MLEEPLVVQQLIDRLELRRQPQTYLRQDRLPQRRLLVYRSSLEGVGVARRRRAAAARSATMYWAP